MVRVPLDRLETPPWADEIKPLDASKIEALLQEVASADSFASPLHVVEEGKRFVVLDGRHRFEAAQRLGWSEVEAEIHRGEGIADALALAVKLHENETPPDGFRAIATRLRAALEAEARGRMPADGATTQDLDPARRRLLRDLLAYLHDVKRVQDGRLAQLFDLGSATAATRLRTDTRGLPRASPLPLHEMPVAVQMGIRELQTEGLVLREDLEGIFPLNERERLHVRAERALMALAREERVKLKGTRWGPDYRTDAPVALRVVAEWPDGRRAEASLDEIPGLDKHTVGIIRKTFAKPGDGR